MESRPNSNIEFREKLAHKRSTSSIDLRKLDRHRDAAVTSLIPLLSCRSCRQNAPFAELVRLSRTSIADEMGIAHTRRVLGD